MLARQLRLARAAAAALAVEDKPVSALVARLAVPRVVAEERRGAAEGVERRLLAQALEPGHAHVAPQRLVGEAVGGNVRVEVARVGRHFDRRAARQRGQGGQVAAAQREEERKQVLARAVGQG